MATERYIPAVKDFDDLIDLAKSRTDGAPRAVMVVPSAVEWLKAAQLAIDSNLIQLEILGDEEVFKRKRDEAGVELDVPVVDINQPEQAIITACQMAARREADMIIKGRGDSIEFFKTILRKESEFRQKGRLVSHITVMKPEAYPKLLAITDSGMVPEPDLKDKLSITQNLIGFLKAIGIDEPRIAAICAVEAIYPQMKSTTDGAVLAKMSDRGQIKGAYVDGPLSFDCAMDPEAAEAKGITDSNVAGQADGMLASSIETANGVYKVMALYGNAQTAGLLVGGRVPVALGHKWDDVDSRFRSILLASLAAQD